MAYATRWRGQFRDYYNNLYEVLIQQDGWNGDVTDITLGDTPVMIDESNNEDLTTSVRGKTGRLEVIDDGSIDIAEIFPTTALSHRVVIEDYFFGYIKPQSSQFPFMEVPRKITLNLQSPLAMVDGLIITGTENTYLTLTDAYLFSTFMNQVGYEYIVLPDYVFSGKNSFIDKRLVCPFRNDNNYHYDNDDYIDYKSLAAILDPIMKAYGWTARDSMYEGHPTLLVTAVDYSGKYYRWDTYSVTYSMWEDREEQSIKGSDVSDILSSSEIAGGDLTEQIVRPYRSILMTMSGELDKNVTPPFNISHMDEFYGYHPLGGWLESREGVTIGYHNAVPNCVNVYSVPGDDITEDTMIFRIKILQFKASPYAVLKLKVSEDSAGANHPLFMSLKTDTEWYDTQNNVWRQLPSAETIQSFDFRTVENREFVLAQPNGTPQYIEVTLYKKKGLLNLESPVYFEKIALETENDVEDIYWVENSFYKRLKGTNGEDELTLTYEFNARFWNNSGQNDASLYPHEPVYLLQSQRRIEVKVRSERPLTYLDYLGLHTVGSDTRWRLIAAKQHIRTNISTLVFHYSPYFLESSENTEQ